MHYKYGDKKGIEKSARNRKKYLVNHREQSRGYVKKHYNKNSKNIRKKRVEKYWKNPDKSRKEAIISYHKTKTPEKMERKRRYMGLYRQGFRGKELQLLLLKK